MYSKLFVFIGQFIIRFLSLYTFTLREAKIFGSGKRGCPSGIQDDITSFTFVYFNFRFLFLFTHDFNRVREGEKLICGLVCIILLVELNEKGVANIIRLVFTCPNLVTLIFFFEYIFKWQIYSEYGAILLFWTLFSWEKRTWNLIFIFLHVF